MIATRNLFLKNHENALLDFVQPTLNKIQSGYSLNLICTHLSLTYSNKTFLRIFGIEEVLMQDFHTVQCTFHVPDSWRSILTREIMNISIVNNKYYVYSPFIKDVLPEI